MFCSGFSRREVFLLCSIFDVDVSMQGETNFKRSSDIEQKFRTQPNQFLSSFILSIYYQFVQRIIAKNSLNCSAGYNKTNEQTMLASRLFNTLEKGIWINEIQDRLDHQRKQYAIARAQIADLCRRYETEERLCTFRNEFESCKSLEIDRWLKPLTSINVRVYICIYIYIIYQSIITRIIRHRLE